MKTYLVGGAVRDALLGHPGADRDWVVVGGTPEALVAQGFEPVGRDFPVFLHPTTREEHALARTERKTARGYRGFVVHAAPEVTLEEDLARRDLTINAIAQDPGTGELTDPPTPDELVAPPPIAVIDPKTEFPPEELLPVLVGAPLPPAPTVTVMLDPSVTAYPVAVNKPPAPPPPP